MVKITKTVVYCGFSTYLLKNPAFKIFDFLVMLSKPEYTHTPCGSHIVVSWIILNLSYHQVSRNLEKLCKEKNEP